jgi:hypothetical protein
MYVHTLVSRGFCCALCISLTLCGMGPIGDSEQSGHYSSGSTATSEPLIVFDLNNMRVIIVGDSQVASMPGTRIRVHKRYWDMPTAGAFVGAHFIWAGQEVVFDVTNIDGLSSREISNAATWSGGGPRDFGTLRGYEWLCASDVDVPDTAFGAYRHYLEYPNLRPPQYDWITGRDILVRVAVRTNPSSVPYVETRATRGGLTDQATGTVHSIQRKHGYQILEQIVPASFAPDGDGTGVSFFLTEGVEELPGENFQVLGVAMLALNANGNPIPGQIVGANAQSGWSVSNHLELSESSRMALIELVDANTLMVMLGHNREHLSGPGFESNYNDLIDLWFGAFESLDRRPPTLISVAPWMIGQVWAPDYLANVQDVMEARCEEDGGIFLSYLDYFDWQVPDEFDPELYTLDGIRTHPNDGDTAHNLSLDMEIMLHQWITEHNTIRKKGRSGREQPGSFAPAP